MIPGTDPDPALPDAPRASGPRGGPIRLCANADAGSVRQVLGLITHRLSEQLPREAAETAQLVIAEVLNNIVEHSYQGRGGPVVLRIRRHRGGVIVSVADCGLAMPAGLLLPAGAPVVRLAEGGFGWPIIRHFARRLSYRSVGRWNRLRFWLPIGATAERGTGS